MGVNLEEGEPHAGPRVELVGVDEPTPAGKPADEHVLGNRELGRDVELLRDEHDPLGLGAMHRAEALAPDRARPGNPYRFRPG